MGIHNVLRTAAFLAAFSAAGAGQELNTPCGVFRIGMTEEQVKKAVWPSCRAENDSLFESVIDIYKGGVRDPEKWAPPVVSVFLDRIILRAVIKIEMPLVPVSKAKDTVEAFFKLALAIDAQRGCQVTSSTDRQQKKIRFTCGDHRYDVVLGARITEPAAIVFDSARIEEIVE